MPEPEASDPFAARLAAAGLRLSPSEAEKLRAAVAELDRAAAGLRGPRPYLLEPMSAFRLRRQG